MEELETKGLDPANLIKRLTDAGPLIEQAHADREKAAEQKLRTTTT